jgi:hypothetical protein
VSQQVRAALSSFAIRAVDMVRLLDTTLVCAVATILIVRTQLWLTNYPQLGGKGLHIAHLLWGGLLMLVAIVVLLAFVSPSARAVAAVVGGVGLGLFVDELGKFVTADNNYFFKPTAAIIYCFFIAFFIAIRSLDRRRVFTQREYLVNVIEILKEGALRDLDESRRQRALALLARADQSDPLVPELRRMLEGVDVRSTAPTAAARAAGRVRAALSSAPNRPWFAPAVLMFFRLWALLSVLQVISLLAFGTAELSSAEVFRVGPRIATNPLGSAQVAFLKWADLAASLLATGFVLAGLYFFAQGRRLAAFTMFERAVLISIFFTQVFAFVYSQFAAVFGLFFNLILFVAVRAMLSRELELDGLRSDAEQRPSKLAPSAEST